MANITLKKEAVPAQVLPRQEYEPFRLMREMLTSFDPFMALRPTIPAWPEITFAPAFEVKETKEGFIFKADVPGVKENEIEINITGNRLVVSGKRESEKEEKGETYYAVERNYGAFSRAFTLPEGVDIEHAKAELKAGVLTLVFPKLPEALPKKIVVKGEEKVKV